MRSPLGTLIWSIWWSWNSSKQKWMKCISLASSRNIKSHKLILWLIYVILTRSISRNIYATWRGMTSVGYWSWPRLIRRRILGSASVHLKGRKNSLRMIRRTIFMQRFFRNKFNPYMILSLNWTRRRKSLIRRLWKRSH